MRQLFDCFLTASQVPSLSYVASMAPYNLGTKLLQQHNTQSNNHRLLSMLPQTKTISKSKQEGTVCQG